MSVGDIVCSSRPRQDGLPVWHEQPFGCHRDVDGPVAEFAAGEVPHPSDFFVEFVAKREPAVFRGAVKDAPGLKEWTDERLMGKEYGDMHVKLEGKREKRSETNRVLTGSLAMGRDLLGHFINRTGGRSHGEDGLSDEAAPPDPDIEMQQIPIEKVGGADVSSLEGYVVSQLPEPMIKDVLVPAVATCGSLSHGLLEANLWISSGNTSSMIHRDADNVFNCVYKGSKSWTLIDPLITSRIPKAAEHEGQLGGVALLNPDRIDATTPQGKSVSGIPYRRVTVHAGDCLFLPWGYWHQVYSPPGRNIAVSLLHGVAHRFHDKDGECSEPSSSSSSSEVGTGESAGGSAGGATAAPLLVPAATRPGAAAASSQGVPRPTATLRSAPWLKPISLESADLLWRYDGLGDMSMGNADPESLRVAFLRLCRFPVSASQFPSYVSERRVKEAMERASKARDVFQRAISDAAEAMGVSNDDEDDDDDGSRIPLDRILTTPPGSSSLWRPNTWDGIFEDDQAAHVAGKASQLAAEALGIDTPILHDMVAFTRAYEARLGRKLSKEEWQWAKMEFSQVGIGAPVLWGGVVTRDAFIEAYATQIVSAHQAEEVVEEEDDEDEESEEDEDELGPGREDLSKARRGELLRAREEAMAMAEKSSLSEEETAAAVKTAEEALEQRWKARETKLLQLGEAGREEGEAMWTRVLDPMGEGVVSAEQILAIPRRLIAGELRVGVSFDPSNTEEWEFYLQDGEAVRNLLLQHWSDRQAAVALYAGNTIENAPVVGSARAMAHFLEEAASAGCGVLHLELWRRDYMERLEGTDAAADRVGKVVLDALKGVGPCSDRASPPEPLTRPKGAAEGGDPSMVVPCMVAMPESAFPSVVESVSALYDRVLKRDPALVDLDAIDFSFGGDDEDDEAD